MVSAIDKYVIKKVKAMRKAKGISLSQLAFELDISKGFLGSVESGKYGKKYNLEQLNEIACALECSPQDFLPVKPFIKDKDH